MKNRGAKAIADQMNKPTENRDSPDRRDVTEPDKVCCIKCGAEIRPGKMLCRKCRKTQPRHYFENCFGPSVIMLALFVGLIVLIVRTVV